MKIQVRIDAAGALRNQRFAFAHRDTLVLELLQNARRAGATNIELHFDAAVAADANPRLFGGEAAFFRRAAWA